MEDDFELPPAGAAGDDMETEEVGKEIKITVSLGVQGNFRAFLDPGACQTQLGRGQAVSMCAPDVHAAFTSDQAASLQGAGHSCGSRCKGGLSPHLETRATAARLHKSGDGRDAYLCLCVGGWWPQQNHPGPG